MTSTEPQITPEDVRSMGRELKVARGGVGEILQARARATCDSAADEIERLTRELAVRDRALRIMANDHCRLSHDDLQYMGETQEDYLDYFVIRLYVEQARAEITAEEAETDAD